MPAIDFSLFRRQKIAVGLDIGSHAVKACELAETPKGLELRSLGNALMPQGAVEDGILQDPAAVAKVISTLLQNLKISGKKVAFSMSGYSVIVKKINLAVMPEAELEKHIHAEAEQYIPFDIADVYLDFQDLKTSGPEEDRTDVMLVAAKKEVVDTYLAMLQGIGLKPVVVDVDAFALENALSHATADDNVGLIDIGAAKININILVGGNSAVTRDVVLGSRQLTEDIAQRLGVDLAEAESLKLGVTPAGEHQAALEEVFSTTVRQWVTEIRRAIDFFSSNYPDEALARLILSGGGSKVQGLRQYLESATGIPVEQSNPFARILTPQDRIDPAYVAAIAPEMAIAVGLATRPCPI
ncbi:MAG: type IV pilus assembly protein PilM [Thermodesulfobacteriota bacterium]